MVTKKEKNNAEKLQEKKDFRNKIIGLIIGILLVIAIVAISTYAYWQLTKKQEEVNSIIAACLDFDLVDIEEDIPSIQLENQWPMNNSDALSTLHGYNFKVVNHCSTAVSYQIALETFSAPEGKTLLDDYSVKVALDDEILGKYGQLTITNTISDGALQARNLRTSTVAGNSFNKHNLKLWIADDASVNEQNKIFKGRLFITGGQYITDNNPGVIATSEECFTINDSGTITGYDKSCGKSVVIPATVNEIQVKKIATNAFKEQYTKSNADLTTYTKITSGEKLVADVKLVRLNDGEIVDEALPNLINNSKEEFNIDSINYEFITEEEANELSDDYQKQDIRIVFDFDCVGNNNDDEEFKSSADFIMYSKSSEINFYIKNSSKKDYLPDIIKYGLSSDYTGNFIDSEDDSYLSQGYSKEYCNLFYEQDNDIETLDYDVPVVDSVDFSKTTELQEIEQMAFHPTVSLDGEATEKANAYVIKHLSFGTNDASIKIGASAFAMSDLDELTIYSSYDITEDPFILSRIDTLKIEVGQGITAAPYTPIKVGGVDYQSSGFFLATVNNMIFGEGIETIRSFSPGKTVTLPSTLKGTIPEYGLYHATTLTNSAIPSGVTKIEYDGFPNLDMEELIIPASITELAQFSFPDFTGTLKIQRTESDFNANVQKHVSWARSATLEFLSD